MKRVPCGAPPARAHAREAEAHAFVLRDADGSVLVDGRVATTAAAAGPPAPPPARPPAPSAPARPPLSCAPSWETTRGFRARFFCVAWAEGSAWPLPAPCRALEGALAPAALTT